MSRHWMPLYIGDYLKDTRRLSTLEHGAYMLLIMEYWSNGGIPNDDRKLARIVGLSDAEWAEIRENMAELFLDDWQHKRINEELSKSEDKSNKAKDAASKRWQNDCNADGMRTHSECNADGDADAMPSLPLPQSLSKKEKAKAFSKDAKGTRITGCWSPDPKDWHLAISEIGMPSADRELGKFRDYWIGIPGSRGRKLDWSATWRNWVKKAADDRKARAGPSFRAGPASVLDAFNTVMDVVEKRQSNGQEPNHPDYLELTAVPYAGKA